MSKKREAPWRNAERHYCAVCNSWMGGDRQSILIHENGKKHKENVEKGLQQKRQAKRDEEQAQKLLQSTLLRIQQTANESYMQDSVTFGDFQTSAIGIIPSSSATAAAFHQTPSVTTAPSASAKQEKKEWESRKKKREEELNKKRDLNDGDDATTEISTNKRLKQSIGPDEGHYTIGDNVYLEGPTFSGILEEEMPVQIWTGPVLSSLDERRLPEREHHWTNGIVVAVRKSTLNEWGVVLDVAYLRSVEDQDETLETSILPPRIRIRLGADDSIPKTLEEARLLALGGEEIQVEHEGKPADVDEATGFSSWNTVSIKRTTVHQELKEERARLRQQRREAILKEEQLKKEREAKKMEEAKVENADDSALGAYDVWSSGKTGYKGVDISKEAQLDIHDIAKSLSQGMGNVEFKKPAFAKKSKKAANRRKTTADEDED